MTIWAADDFEYTEIHDSVEDFVAALHGEPTNADLNRWGLYRQATYRHYGMLTEAERDKLRLAANVQRRQQRNRHVETTQRCATHVWQWLLNRNVALFGLAALALWVALWWWAL
jgi:hypothetical protein